MGYSNGKGMDGLMTLKGYIEGGNEVPAMVRVLVCVRSIGGYVVLPRTLPAVADDQFFVARNDVRPLRLLRRL